VRVGTAGRMAGILVLGGLITSPGDVNAGDASSGAVESPIAVGRIIFESGAAGPHERALVFNATTCEECHTHGAGGSGPKRGGPVPVGLVIRLGSLPGASGGDGDGDPVYGRVLNTAAAEGMNPEGSAKVRYGEIEGHYYPEGFKWRIRVPHYELTSLSRGPLAATTVIKPRLAPSLYGASLLESVPESSIIEASNGTRVPATAGEPVWRWYHGLRVVGRFGWQGESVSIRDQAAKAFVRELGLTSLDEPDFDCTPLETDCLPGSRDSSPAIAESSLTAIEAYLGTLRAPEPRSNPEAYSAGLQLFIDLGCASCHRPELPVELSEASAQARTKRVIAPYTDLRVHDLGAEMDDRTVSGKRVTSKWRTAPLWGLASRINDHSSATLLHDGRARSAEEAILWHGGEAAESRQRFVSLLGNSRNALLRWLESL
jgi:CxxC motif-containing protein (DUF1111 family)